MAENEIKNLEENNLIDEKDLKNNAPENAQLVEEGQVSASELRNVIDIDAVLEEAKKNDLYSNMLEPCQKMGVNINAQLIAFFEEEVTDLSDIKTSIQRGMERIKNRINKDNPYLAFDDSGNIDSAGIRNKIGKGQVPEYLKEYLEPEKEQVEENAIPKGLEKYKDLEPKLLKELVNVNEVYRDSFVDLYKATEKMITDPETKVHRDENGDVVAVINKKNSDKKNRLITFSQRLMDKMKTADPTKINSFNDQRKEIMNLFSDLYSFMEQDFKDMTEEEKLIYDTCIDGFETVIKSFVPTFEISSIDFSDKEATFDDMYKILSGSLILGTYTKDKMIKELEDFNNSFEKKFIEAQELDQQPKEEIIDVEEQRRIIDDYGKKQRDIFMIQISTNLINRYKKSNDIYGTKGTKTFVERAEQAIKEKNPQYYEEAIDTNMNNDYVDVYMNILKDRMIKERLRKWKEKNTDLEKENYFYAEEAVDLVFIFEGTKSKDEHFRKECYEVLLNKFSNIKSRFDINELVNGKNEQVTTFSESMYQEFLFEFGNISIFEKLKSGENLENYSRYLVENNIRGKILKGAIGDENDRDEVYSIFNNKEFNEEAKRRIEERQKDIIEKNLLQDFLIQINDLKNIRDFEPDKFNEYYKLELISKSVTALLLYKDVPGDKQQTFIENTLKGVLVDYLPEIFNHDGTLKDDDKISEAYEEYLNSRNIAKVFTVDDVFDEMHSKVESRINGESSKGILLEETEAKLHKTNSEIGKDMAMASLLDNLKLVETLKEYVNENIKDEELLIKFNEHIDGIDTRTIKKIDGLGDSIAKSRKKDGMINDISSYKESINNKVSNIRKRNFKKDKLYHVLKQGKEFIVNNKIEKIKTNIGENSFVDDATKKEILKTYFSFKEELDFSHKPKISKELNELLSFVNPDFKKDEDIQEERVLEEYNRLFNTNEKNCDNLILKYGNELILDFVVAIDDQFSLRKSNIDLDLQKIVLNNTDSYVKSKLDEEAERKQLDTELVLMSLCQAGMEEINEGNASQAREEETLKNLVVLAYLTENKEYNALTFIKRKEETKEIEKQMSQLVSSALQVIFPETIKEDGKIDFDKLDDAMKGYFEKRNKDYLWNFEAGDDLGSRIIQEYYENENPLESISGIRMKEIEMLFQYSENNINYDETIYIEAGEKIRQQIEKSQLEVAIAQDEIEPIVGAFGEEMKVVDPGERLAEEIADEEAEIPEISDEEVRDVIKGRGEDMTVSQPVVQEKDKQIADEEVEPTFKKKSEDINITEPGIEEVIEDVVDEPKTAQVMVAEDINVGENEEEKTLVVKNENPIRVMFENVRKTIKDVLENVASKFGFGTSSGSDSSSNDTTNSSSSSSGTEKPVQDTTVKVLTGYDQIPLVSPIEQEKAEGTGEPKIEKATRESDDTERG